MHHSVCQIPDADGGLSNFDDFLSFSCAFVQFLLILGLSGDSYCLLQAEYSSRIYAVSFVFWEEGYRAFHFSVLGDTINAFGRGSQRPHDSPELMQQPSASGFFCFPDRHRSDHSNVVRSLDRRSKLVCF